MDSGKNKIGIFLDIEKNTDTFSIFVDFFFTNMILEEYFETGLIVI